MASCIIFWARFCPGQETMSGLVAWMAKMMHRQVISDNEVTLSKQLVRV